LLAKEGLLLLRVRAPTGSGEGGGLAETGPVFSHTLGALGVLAIAVAGVHGETTRRVVCLGVCGIHESVTVAGFQMHEGPVVVVPGGHTALGGVFNIPSVAMPSTLLRSTAGVVGWCHDAICSGDSRTGPIGDAGAVVDAVDESDDPCGPTVPMVTGLVEVVKEPDSRLLMLPL